jgi:hypothetical protein
MGLNRRLFIPQQDTGGVVNTENFATVLYTGSGSTGKNVSGVGFEADFIWIKTRSHDANHIWQDRVRGITTKQLYSDVTNSEGSGTTLVTATDTDGFTLGNSSDVNQLNRTYVAWCWKAGGTAASNTDGLITSSVSANTTAGFSIVKWEGNSTAPNVGHGLSQEPELLIIKSINNTANWYLYLDIYPR